MDFKDYVKRMILLMKISNLPIDNINAEVGFLRLQDISLYEPCLQYAKEKYRRLATKSLNSKRSSKLRE